MAGGRPRPPRPLTATLFVTTHIVTVRALLPGEVDLWRDIRLRALRDAPDAFGTTYEQASTWPGETWTTHVGWATAPDALQAVYLASLGETFVGCARASQEDARETALVTAMWVDPAARRRGVAQALLEACEVWARSHGCRTVELEVAELNPGARLLYERAGFEVTGEIRQLREGSTARTVVMAKTLAAVSE